MQKRTNMYVPAHLTNEGKEAIKEGLYPLLNGASEQTKSTLQAQLKVIYQDYLILEEK